MRDLLKNKIFRRLLLVLVAVVLLVLLGMELCGSFEIIGFNSGSITDWRLGGKVDGIDSASDGKNVDIRGFEWFELNGEVGLVDSDGTRYYMGNYPADAIGGFRIVGFSTTEKVYSVLSIRIGDDINDATMLLMDKGYSMDGGGLNKCRAVNGHVTVILYFEHGVVTRIEARLK